MTTPHALYLHTLVLKNFATFELQTVRFDKGFNAIIGETGSGKSLILEALQIVLGHRAEKKLIRNNSPYALVEASFFCREPKVKQYFLDIGHPFDEDEIYVKRLIYASGKTKSFLNHSPCNVSTLVKFSRHFIDLVGQFENQKLLSADYQLGLLDSYSKLRNHLQHFQQEYKELKQLKLELEKCQKDQVTRNQKIQFLEFQIEELNRLSPSVVEEQDLLARKKQQQNILKKSEFLQGILENLSGEGHKNDLLTSLKRILLSCQKNRDFIDPQILLKLEEAFANLSEISFSLAKDNREQCDQSLLDGIMERLDLYQKVKRKYGLNTEELCDQRTKFLAELEMLQNLEKKISELSQSLHSGRKKCLELAEKIHRIRTAKALDISGQLTKIARELKMEGATIKLEVSQKSELDDWGNSQIHFLAETNPGEGFFPIAECASGGELSRILLAFRQVISIKDSISIFLFDEIDAGIGGATALRIGMALKKVAQNGQVVAITHLPQIASQADKLVVVSKEVNDDNKKLRTKSSIREITGKGHKREEILAMVPLQ